MPGIFPGPGNRSGTPESPPLPNLKKSIASLTRDFLGEVQPTVRCAPMIGMAAGMPPPHLRSVPK